LFLTSARARSPTRRHCHRCRGVGCYHAWSSCRRFRRDPVCRPVGVPAAIAFTMARIVWSGHADDDGDGKHADARRDNADRRALIELDALPPLPRHRLLSRIAKLQEAPQRRPQRPGRRDGSQRPFLRREFDRRGQPVLAKMRPNFGSFYVCRCAVCGRPEALPRGPGRFLFRGFNGQFG
jgi:hypothetical protein